MPAKKRALYSKEQLRQKKAKYMERTQSLLEEYPRFLIVTCDFIGSKHMQNVRLSLRPSGSQLLMGKNTLMKKAIRMKVEEHPEWDQIVPLIKHNCGLVFTKGSLTDLRDKLLESTVPAVAKAGVIAPDDVMLPKQVTALEPTKTSFFAALDIATKITRGCVEILNDVKLCEKGRKVGSSEAALLQMLDIKPFTYGLKIKDCYDSGSTFAPPFLDFTESDLFKSISVGIGQTAALSLALSWPTLPAFPHVIVNGFKNLVAVCLETNYLFKEAEELKKRVDNPDAYASSTPVVSEVAKTDEKKVEAVVEVVEEQEEEEMGDLMDFF
jgi:large subunit ribosomal protein LP0